MGNAHQLVQYKPLASKDHREKGFNFAGCSIVVAAMKRWPTIVDRYAGTWEDYLREQYLREARLQDALVINLGTGEPLTEAEVRAADPYCLAVLYEDGNQSKVWEEPRVDRAKAMKVWEKPDGQRNLKMKRTIQPCFENIVGERHFNGSPCKRCLGTLRFITSRECIVCSKATEARFQARKRAAR